MDGIIEWLRTWTFFNWLAVIAFLMAFTGFLNSFLSLRSRYKDWRGVQSRKAFGKRLKELETRCWPSHLSILIPASNHLL